eukprot:UN04072
MAAPRIQKVLQPVANEIAKKLFNAAGHKAQLVIDVDTEEYYFTLHAFYKSKHTKSRLLKGKGAIKEEMQYGYQTAKGQAMDDKTVFTVRDKKGEVVGHLDVLLQITGVKNEMHVSFKHVNKAMSQDGEVKLGTSDKFPLAGTNAYIEFYGEEFTDPALYCIMLFSK